MIPEVLTLPQGLYNTSGIETDQPTMMTKPDGTRQMSTAPLATLFTDPRLQAAFANGAADALDLFLVPTSPSRKPPMALAAHRSEPKPILAGGAATCLELA